MPTDDSPREEDLLRRLDSGDEGAAAELFAQHQAGLRRMIELRLDRRLRGRLDPSDVLQEAYLDAAGRAERRGDLPVHLWLRRLTRDRLRELHRRHLGAAKRSARDESATFADHLLAGFSTPSLHASREEMRRRLLDGLEQMEELDREILMLRHFEQLTNAEVCVLLGIKKAAASNRYVRALKRLRDLLPGE